MKLGVITDCFKKGVKKGIKTLEAVPENIRPLVEQILGENGV